MVWKIEYLLEAEKDLEKLDNSQRLIVFKAIRKVSKNPLPNYQGGYGKPLGNYGNTKLSGYLKIKLKKHGVRIIYKTIEEEKIMKIVVISVRDNYLVYKEAEDRVNEDSLIYT
ncbi:MAG: type II toxin-antitoxin system RelE/ParE family toxin [Bacillota bacterium]|nr:type II toxin-antitoxin system RelE/ParE family toxin [Bacillota bacterium]